MVVSNFGLSKELFGLGVKVLIAKNKFYFLLVQSALMIRKFVEIHLRQNCADSRSWHQQFSCLQNNAVSFPLNVTISGEFTVHRHN
jgi:hypothetical protein